MARQNGFLPWIQTDIGTRTSRVVSLVQRGTIVMSTSESTKTAAITSVDTALSELTNLGVSVTGGTDGARFIRLTLTDSSTITADRAEATSPATVAYQVITRP